MSILKLRLQLLIVIALGCTQLQFAQTDSKFSTTYLLESDLYANHLKKELDNNTGNKTAYEDAVEVGRLLRFNAASYDPKIPIPMPPCKYNIICGSNQIEGIVTKDISFIDASIIDANDNVVATLNVSPIFTDTTSGIKVYSFIWTHQVFGEVTLNLTRPSINKGTEQYNHKVVLQ
ncbi:hypothetical protein ABN763_14225 [Spongiivirga sp. MCCC 1A20706]|uniref:hypothetical protein n=1 Tax=Spongiivirga sp. MCCC 1A20706 TaxID=3160963 RepID=UPI00397757FC